MSGRKKSARRWFTGNPGDRDNIRYPGSVGVSVSASSLKSCYQSLLYFWYYTKLNSVKTLIDNMKWH